MLPSRPPRTCQRISPFSRAFPSLPRSTEKSTCSQAVSKEATETLSPAAQHIICKGMAETEQEVSGRDASFFNKAATAAGLASTATAFESRCSGAGRSTQT